MNIYWFGVWKLMQYWVQYINVFFIGGILDIMVYSFVSNFWLVSKNFLNESFLNCFFFCKILQCEFRIIFK